LDIILSVSKGFDMPTYEYECSSCGHTFEAFQSMSDTPLSSCPQCGQAVKRLIFGGTGVIFKGSGFYVNDSRKKSSSPGSKPAGDAVAAKEGASAKEGIAAKEGAAAKEGSAAKESPAPAPAKARESA